jgi:hypothetical protein
MTNAEEISTRPFFKISKITLIILFGVLQFVIIMGLFYGFHQNASHPLRETVVNLGKTLPYIGPMEHEGDLTIALNEDPAVSTELNDLLNSGVMVNAERNMNSYVLNLSSLSQEQCNELLESSLLENSRFGFQTMEVNHKNFHGGDKLCQANNRIALSYPVER